MRHRFYHIIAGLFLTLAATPLLFISIQMVRQQWIRHAMKERLEMASLQQFSIPAEDLHWVVQDKEISVKGKLIDVKTITRDGGRYLVQGLPDEEEEAILRQLNQSQDPVQKQLLCNALQVLLIPVYYQQQDIDWPVWQSIATPKYIAGKSLLCTQSSPVTTPPPDLNCL